MAAIDYVLCIPDSRKRERRLKQKWITPYLSHFPSQRETPTEKMWPSFPWSLIALWVKPQEK